MCRNGRPALIYSLPGEVQAFEEALLWSGRRVAGFGQCVHIVSSDGGNSVSHHLESHFGHLYVSSEYILVASAEAVRHIDKSG